MIKFHCMNNNKNEIENNALFWQKLDSLFFSSDIVIDRKRGSVHPSYSNLIYPVDYGYLNDTLSTDGFEIDVFVGSEKKQVIDTMIVSADLLKKDIEVKILYGCNDEELDEVLKFMNQTDFQKTILVRRSNEIPVWAEI